MKNRGFNQIDLGDLTCKSYGNFMFLKLEIKYRLTTQKTIEL